MTVEGWDAGSQGQEQVQRQPKEQQPLEQSDDSIAAQVQALAARVEVLEKECSAYHKALDDAGVVRPFTTATVDPVEDPAEKVDGE